MTLLAEALDRTHGNRTQCSVAALTSEHPDLADELDEALAHWVEHGRPYLSKIIEVVADRVGDGVPKADAMSRHARGKCRCK